jgi:opacity protein-like surface antigen
MIKSVLFSSALALGLAVPAVAAAQAAPGGGGGSCPPGSWFCAEPPQQRATPAGQPVQPLTPLPDPDESSEAPEHSAPAETKPSPPPPVVVYQPPPPAMEERPQAPPPYVYARPRREAISPPHEWGLNLHLEGAMIGSGAQGNAGLGGAGAGLRFKPVRSFGIEADLDFAGGDHDYQGNKRSEGAFTLSGLLFLNPRSHAQIYLLAGFGWSSAHVTCDGCATPVDSHYDYFGGQIGAGLELRLTRVLAFNADIRGFMRGRTDQLAQRQPEFDQPSGCSSSPTAVSNCRSTNTSGGGLLTGGMTLYF